MADPDDCKVCARLTKKTGKPTKCKRHGGEPKRATGRATKSRPGRAPAAAAAAVTLGAGNGTRAKAQELLADLVRLRSRLGHVRELVEIL